MKRTKIKRFIALVLSLLIIMSVAPVVSVSADGFSGTISNGCITITNYSGYDANVVIPKTIRFDNGMTYSVTGIGKGAFSNCSSLESISIPYTVTNIGEEAFSYCSSLKSISIPSRVARISKGMFLECSSLKSVTFASEIKSIGEDAFKGCSVLSDIDIPSTVESIGSGAFHNTAIYNDKSNWQDGALYLDGYLVGAEDTISECDIKEGTKLIAGGVFSDCEFLTRVTIPDGLMSIGNDAFVRCSLTDVVLPSSVKSIGDNAFLGSASLEKVTIPEGISTIGERAFYDCSSLNSITIPSSVTHIGSGAFLNTAIYKNADWQDGLLSLDSCVVAVIDNVERCYIGKEIRLIADGVFDGHRAAPEVVYYNGDRTSWSEIVVGEDNEKLSSAKLQYVDDSFIFGFDYSIYNNEAVITDYYGYEEELIIPDTLEECPVAGIGYEAFEFSNNLKSITIPKSVTKIEDRAFFACFSLESVIIPEGVTSIGHRAFDGNESLESITIPNSVRSIGYYAFNYCESLKNITIPSNVSNIGSGAFYNTAFYNDSDNWEDDVLYIGEYLIGAKDTITECHIREGTKLIADGAFYDCTFLEKVTIPTSVVSIGEDAFNNTAIYNNSNWDNGVISIDSCVLAVKDNVESIYLKSDTRLIADGVFGNYTDLKNIYYCGSESSWDKVLIGENNNKLNDVTMHFVSPDFILGLKYSVANNEVTITDYSGPSSRVVIPDMIEGYPVTAIGDAAFSGCSQLSIVTIPASVTSIGEEAFRNCKSLKNITIPSNVSYIGSDAFYNTALYNNSNNWEDDVLYIGDYLIEARETITECDIKEGTKLIADSAFYYCESLENVTIPSSVTNIGEDAFHYTALYNTADWNYGVLSIDSCIVAVKKYSPENVYIEADTRLVADGVFNEEYSELEDVFYCGDEASWNNVLIGSKNPYLFSATLHYVASDYIFGWDYYIDDGEVTLIDYYGYESEVVIPDTIKGYPVTGIGSGVFDYCYDVEKITIPDGIVSISSGAFESTAFYKDDNNWEDGVLYIGDYLIEAKDSITVCNIRKGTQTIADSAFEDCELLTEITIPESVISIGYRAFESCEALENVSLPSSITHIGEDAFIDTALYEKSINWKHGCLCIDSCIVDARSSISINAYGIESDIRLIADGVFNGRVLDAKRDIFYCGDESAWNKIIVGNSNENLSNAIFHWLYPDFETALEFSVANGEATIVDYRGSRSEIAIPDTIYGYPVTAIGDEAFYGCSKLSNVIIPESVTRIGEDAFNNTAIYNNADWQTGLLSIDSCVVAAKDKNYRCYIESDTRLIADGVFGEYRINPDNVYYCGNESSWNDIIVGNNNEELFDAVLHYVNSDFVVGLDYSVENGKVTITDYYGPAVRLTIPDTIDGLQVTGIGSGAFESCDELTSVILPKYVTSIGDKAFYDCDNLDSVIIPQSVRCIGNRAFMYCRRLTNVSLPNGLSSIGDEVFYDCENLVGITIPSSVASIGEKAFYDCESLKSIKIPSGVMSIRQSAFSGTAIHNDSNNWEDGVLYIDKCLIEAKDTITECNIKKGTNLIADYAFYDCASLESVAIPSSVTSIGEGAFEYCSGLSSVSIPESVKCIDDFTFYQCTSLESITIPESVTRIGDYAFGDCSNLSDITIPSSITCIGADAFKDTAIYNNTDWKYGLLYVDSCVVDSVGSNIGYYVDADTRLIADGVFGESYWEGESPDVIYYEGNKASWKKIIVGSENGRLSSATIHYNASDAAFEPEYSIYDGEATVEHYSGPARKLIIPDTIDGYPVTSISVEAFWWCTSLENITLPDSITDIGSDAFYNTAFINNSDNWEDDMLYIGNYLIKAKDTVTGCNIKEGTKLIADSAFSNCSTLVSVTIPSSVTSIGYLAFSGCNNLEGVYISDLAAWCNIEFGGLGNPLNYADYLYLNNKPVTELVIDKSIESINSNAFEGYVNLKSVSVPPTLKNIGCCAFDCCSGLETVYITDLSAWCNINFDGYEANPLYYAKNLYLNGKLITDLSVPKGTTRVGAYAFYECDKLTQITIPSSVEKIGEYAFYGCKNIGLVNILDGVSDIGDEAFADCSGVKSIVIPDSVTRIGESAFERCENLSEITLSDNVAEVGTYAFLGTAYYNDANNWQNNVLYIDKVLVKVDQSYSGHFSIKKGTTVIADSAFSYCCDITSVTIPESVKSIGKWSFYLCTNLTSLTIPKSVELINEYAILQSPNVKEIDVLSGNKNYVSVDGVLYNKDKTVLIRYPEGKTQSEFVIPDGVSRISENAFYWCKNLVSLTFPPSVKEIETDAFTGCSNLENVYIFDLEAWQKIEFRSYSGDAEYHTNDPMFYAENLYLNGVLVEDPTSPSAPDDSGNVDPTNPDESDSTNPSQPDDSISQKLTGDANGDGKVNVKDATEIQKAVAGLLTLDETEKVAADVDGSGKVNVKDATAIQKWVAGIETGFLIGEPIKKQ